MINQTRGADYLDFVNSALDENNIDIQKFVCVCTNGCPSMTGSLNGFIETDSIETYI